MKNLFFVGVLFYLVYSIAGSASSGSVAVSQQDSARSGSVVPNKTFVSSEKTGTSSSLFSFGSKNTGTSSSRTTGGTVQTVVPMRNEETSGNNFEKQLSKYFSQNDIQVITAAAKRNNLQKELWPVLFAIRKAENGKKGREFGILSEKCDKEIKKAPDRSLDIQAGWCASTIKKNYSRWDGSGDFINYLGSVYCPVGANNDPKGLNKNWIKNVSNWIKKLS